MTDPDAIPLPPPAALPADAPPAEPPLVAIGEIVVTRSSVQLPEGRYPLRGTTWSVHDATQVNEYIPTYAIVLAVVVAVFTCLLGLLFLLIKERQYTGFVAVTVAGEGLHRTVYLPPGPESAAWANYQVSQARAIAAAA